MKTSAVASALLLALASTSTVAATVYSNDGTELSIGGRAEFRGDFTDAVEGSMEDNSRARLNVKGSSEITSGLTAFAFYEAEHKTGDKQFSNRYLYAGLDTEVGAFSAGRQDMAAVIVSDMTDITEFSGLQQYTDASSDKTNSVFAYRGSFDAVQVEATYSAAEGKDEDLYSIAGMYSAPFGLDVALSYSADAGDETQFLGGLGYTFENLYVAGTFSVGDVDNNTEFTAYELSAAYKLTSEFSVALNYGYAEEDEKGAGKTDTVDQFEVAGYYKFNSNFRTYVSYLAQQLKDEDDVVRLGVRYDF
ncbi:porin [Vibrio astriarenae]|uniref:Porin n=1 Tax=Vibrio astriarenae TaxID=1481923 RepID=A0A7Z2YFZ7_9VIBR|nr:porin [Vibrio astriarenae]QIA65973.1 porin [Vibrio astriarenae]